MTAPPAPLWRVSGAQRLLALGSLLGAVAFFAVMPFGALYLDQYTQLGAAAIGATVGSVSLVGALGGVLGGMVVDRVGAVRAMQVGLGLDVVAYGLFAAVRGQALIIGLFLLLGVARMLFEPASKRLMSMSSDDGRIFRLRYMTLCAGAIVGPLAGGLLYNVDVALFFAVPAVLYGSFLVLITRNAALLQQPPADGQRPPAYPVARALGDRRLLAAIAAGLIIFLVFSQLETMVPLVMRSHFGHRTEVLFAWLLVGNAALALLLQPVIDRLSTRISHGGLVAIGIVGFASSFGCFAAMGLGIGWLFLGIVFWTIGEGTLLPLPDMAVHELAGDAQKATYFGLSELRYLGFFLGPLLGGWLLGDGGRTHGSATAYFVSAALAAVCCAPFLVRRAARTAGPVPEGSAARAGADGPLPGVRLPGEDVPVQAATGGGHVA